LTTCRRAGTSRRLRYSCVLFDFDYTLADSSEPAVECINGALSMLGYTPASHEVACRTIGLSLSKTFRLLTGELDDVRAAEFTHCFLERAKEVMVSGTRLYPTASATLRSLSHMGARLGIVSTKNRYMIEQIVLRDGISPFVDIIIGGEDVIHHKPDPEGIHAAARSLGTEAGEVVYVGDSIVDAEAAQRAGSAFIAVLSGTTPADDFLTFRPQHVLASLAELPAVLRIPESEEL
jgi:phosphoglycolate phosphatase